jgi:hypothetical protein
MSVGYCKILSYALIVIRFVNHEPNNLIAFTDDVRLCIELARPETKDRTAEMPFALSLFHLPRFCCV